MAWNEKHGKAQSKLAWMQKMFWQFGPKSRKRFKRTYINPLIAIRTSAEDILAKEAEYRNGAKDKYYKLLERINEYNNLRDSNQIPSDTNKRSIIPNEGVLQKFEKGIHVNNFHGLALDTQNQYRDLYEYALDMIAQVEVEIDYLKSV